MTKTIQSKLATALLLLLGCSLAQAYYAGVGVGYMIDNEDELISAHVGWEFAKKEMSHNLELEVGFVDDSEMGLDLEVVPVMVNYRIINSPYEKVRLYFGVGAGFSKVKISGYGVSDSDEVLTLQGMVGAEIPLARTIYLRLGYRYFYIDDVDLFEADLDSLDDSILEAAVTFQF